MISPRANVSKSSEVSDSAKVWDFAQVRENAIIGEEVVVGAGAYIGSGVSIGARSKIQNYALIYEPATIKEGVFIGPAVILTNDRNPRAINIDKTQKSISDWQAVGVTVEEGASIGARSVCIAPVKIGAWSMVGAGSTVTKDVPPYALFVGNPAKQIGWVGRAGMKLLAESESSFVCPLTGDKYVLKNGELGLL
jgi:UDP-2-acetamido-3-amino-2,3-dideoxy-glucuronate N-acetyltransferase